MALRTCRLVQHLAGCSTVGPDVVSRFGEVPITQKYICMLLAPCRPVCYPNHERNILVGQVVVSAYSLTGTRCQFAFIVSIYREARGGVVGSGTVLQA
jgi:hypothetical protein